MSKRKAALPPSSYAAVDHVQIKQTLTQIEIRQRYRGERVDIGIDTEDIDHLKIKHEIALLKSEVRKERFNNNEDEGPPPPEPTDDVIIQLVSQLSPVRGGWREFFLREFSKTYTFELLELLRERKNNLVPSNLADVLKAFRYTEGPKDIKVLLLGNKALKWRGFNGMGFGTTEACDSYQVLNLYKELGGEYDATMTSWAEQGVLCLSVGLTCSGTEDHSEQWSKLVETIISKCLVNNKQLQSIAVGYDAKKLFNTAVSMRTGSLEKAQCVFTTDYLYKSDFIRSRVFANTNTQLRQHKQKLIQWVKDANMIID
ncbi:uracil-DNA glycosylase [Crucian carp herpesvirus]|uniref:Uracil-DNA glycosylase n=1 Tax=Cyprinid herpesvirus 2 TaxID=317878 RepID=K7PCD4_CYHV2|nr:uracil-DNA glycosylase [Cyprinid herpesvirus 2]APD51580.1 uracil-DNA glycosylase [Crucian carp herpesvirus]AFJ20527.1 uracil-DNA glycosylase [Cyprinid herpesvirus 2]AKC02044.1 hypothetical protein [Cyprinid herpesvirus 2]AMB21667.1 uracil-DNA glycosylase [Cyprinid herpesvirus 2]QIM55267.1 uracil-DNA glycosylase [Cyprinid herpesvirus 2]